MGISTLKALAASSSLNHQATAHPTGHPTCPHKHQEITSGDQTCHGISLLSTLSMDRSFLCSEPGSNILSASSTQPWVHGSKPTGTAGTSWCGQILEAPLKVQYLGGGRGCPSYHKLLTGMASAGVRVSSSAGGLLCHRGGMNVETSQSLVHLARPFHGCKDKCPPS